MGLTRPKLLNFDTSVSTISDPITVLHSGATQANVDVGFLVNRANGLLANSAIYWNESGSTFVTAFTSNTGGTDTNVTISSYAPISSGNHTVNGTLIATAVNSPTIGNTSASHIGSTGTFSGTVIAATVNAATIGNTGASLIGSTGTFSGTVIAATVNAGTIGNTGATLNGTLSTSAQITSTLADGTAPFAITSTTKVTNLNVERVDGYHADTANTVSTIAVRDTAANITASGFVGTHWGPVAATTANVTAGTASTSTATGALTVSGGAGITGNIYVGAVYTTSGLFWAANNNVISSGGGGSAAVGNTGQVQYNNGGVLGATSLYFYSANNAVVVANTTASSSTTTGALQILGGVGIGGALYVGGVTTISGATTLNTATTGSLQGIIGNVTPASGAFTTLTSTSTMIASGNIVGASGTASTSTTTGALVIAGSGGAGIGGALYAGSVYDNGIRVVSTSSNSGNLTISSGAINLTSHGPGVTNVGSSTAIPTIVTDAYGRITSLTSNAVSTTITLAGGSGSGSVAGGGTLTVSGGTGITTSVSSSTITITNSGVTSAVAGTGIGVSGATGAVTITNSGVTSIAGTANQITASASTGSVTLSLPNPMTTPGALTVTGNITTQWHLPSANVSYNLGSSTAWWNLVYGKSIQAQYADLAECYVADDDYGPGTVVVFGGEKEITITDKVSDTRVAGVISTAPAYLMNALSDGLPVAMTGRVPCQVKGPVAKGDVLVTSSIPGVAQRIGIDWQPGCVLGKALEPINTNNIETIEVVVGRF